MRSVLVLAAIVSLILPAACNGDGERQGSGGGSHLAGDSSVSGQSGKDTGGSASPAGGAESNAAGGGGAPASGGNAASGMAGSVATSGASGASGAQCPVESPAKTPSVCSAAQQGKLCRYDDACFFCGCMPQQSGMYCVYGAGDCPAQ